MATQPLNKYLEKPDDLCADGDRLYEIVLQFLKDYHLLYTGHCKAFYSPQEWRDRGEEWGRSSLLVVVYDGGDLMSAFDYNCSDELPDKLQERLMEAGFFFERCTSWYSAIYKS